MAITFKTDANLRGTKRGEVLDRPAGFNELVDEPVEQLRVGRLLARGAEVAGCADQSRAENISVILLNSYGRG
jgi:hypothetical protein